MCGIYFSIVRGNDFAFPSDDLEARLRARGPDSFDIVKRASTARIGIATGIDDGTIGDYGLLFCASVLSLRGSSILTQPCVAEDEESLLLWNGEAWTVDDHQIYENDTASVFELLKHAARLNKKRSVNDADSVVEALRSIKGPYALVFFDGSCVYYSRDPVGRRSLLRRSSRCSFELASITDGVSGWEEVDAGSICRVSIRNNSASSASPEYQQNDGIVIENMGLLSIKGTVNRDLPTEGGPELHTGAASVDKLYKYLQQSLNLRLYQLPKPHSRPSGAIDDTPARVAILFSGGLDCTVVARIAHDILPKNEPLDLLNVAFQNPRIQNSQPANISPYDSCPDRQTARESFEELRKVCDDRRWRLVEINVPYEEYQAHRASIMSLMAPHNTEMDLSIASALYFAARGQGELCVAKGRFGDQNASIQITSGAKVLLSGLGADELFGGYQRHATAFTRHGITGLLDELELDITRLGKRNCGRDDRIISHWSREVRYPYLDEDLVSWAVQEPFWNKCGFHLDVDRLQKVEGMSPDKLVLRLLALKLGMRGASLQRKRAIQFGARTAKMEAGKRKKGTDLLD